MLTASPLLAGPFIRMKQAAELLGVTPKTIYVYADTGGGPRGGRKVRLKTWLVGGTLKTTRAALEKFVEELNGAGESVAERAIG